MKRILLAPALLAILAMGCQNKTNTSITPGDNSSSTSGTITSGKWTVSYFYDNDKDETSDYSGYTFGFNDDKTLSATLSGATTTGTWGEITDDGMPRLVITLNTTDDKLVELNDDWVIESKTDTQIKLKDDNPDRNEQLHFTRQ